MNSVNGGREGDGGGSKKREKRDMMNVLAPTLRTQHIAESTPKKKVFLFFLFPFPLLKNYVKKK